MVTIRDDLGKFINIDFTKLAELKTQLDKHIERMEKTIAYPPARRAEIFTPSGMSKWTSDGERISKNNNDDLAKINEIKRQIEEANKYLDDFKVLTEKSEELNLLLNKMVNNLYLNTKGTLGQLALSALPRDKNVLKSEIEKTLNEDINLSEKEKSDIIDTYMSEVEREENKLKGKLVKPTIPTTGGKSKKHKKSKSKSNHKKTKKH